jgi:hypothetical protein
MTERRINLDDKVGQQRTCYLLWGQYSDYSGHVHIGVYGTREKAEEAKNMIDLGGPTYDIKVSPVEWRY